MNYNRKSYTPLVMVIDDNAETWQTCRWMGIFTRYWQDSGWIASFCYNSRLNPRNINFIEDRKLFYKSTFLSNLKKSNEVTLGRWKYTVIKSQGQEEFRVMTIFYYLSLLMLYIIKIHCMKKDPFSIKEK